mmetsp:Transcript_99924/g.278262  ORF Transcript_99924/g.278262 Transcript_99924/m.278262 type:complete len:229 (-) Transcript_99924:583-1269(-)
MPALVPKTAARALWIPVCSSRFCSPDSVCGCVVASTPYSTASSGHCKWPAGHRQPPCSCNCAAKRPAVPAASVSSPCSGSCSCSSWVQGGTCPFGSSSTRSSPAGCNGDWGPVSASAAAAKPGPDQRPPGAAWLWPGRLSANGWLPTEELGKPPEPERGGPNRGDGPPKDPNRLPLDTAAEALEPDPCEGLPEGRFPAAPEDPNSPPEANPPNTPPEVPPADANRPPK